MIRGGPFATGSARAGLVACVTARFACNRSSAIVIGCRLDAASLSVAMKLGVRNCWVGNCARTTRKSLSVTIPAALSTSVRAV